MVFSMMYVEVLAAHAPLTDAKVSFDNSVTRVSPAWIQ
jgi:hypothetical protein